MNNKELNEILEKHAKWLFGDTEGMRANLYRADLRGADLSGANLYRADLREADLCEADLCEAKNVPYIPMVCPDTGSFIGWKKAKAPDARDCLVKLEIPSDARRTSATGRKCRCDKANVLAIFELTEDVSIPIAYSTYRNDFVYEVGKIVSVDNFSEDRFDECAPGIHFFINKQEAIDY